MEHLDNQDQQLIDDYIMNRLDANQRMNFEQQLEASPALSAQVEVRREVIGGIERFAQDRLRTKLKGIHREVIEGETARAPRRILPYVLAAAASVAVLLIALTFFFPGEQSSSEIYASYFQAHEISLGERDVTNAQLLELDDLYQKKEYATALPLFETLLKTEGNTSELHLGAGISALELNDYTKALFHFNSILGDQDFLYSDHAMWYASLAYVKQDKKEAALPLLTQLANDPTADHYQEAQRLLKELQ